MTLYKGTLEDENLEDDEPQVEPARIPLTLRITDETTFTAQRPPIQCYKCNGPHKAHPYDLFMNL